MSENTKRSKGDPTTSFKYGYLKEASDSEEKKKFLFSLAFSLASCLIIGMPLYTPAARKTQVGRIWYLATTLAAGAVGTALSLNNCQVSEAEEQFDEITKMVTKEEVLDREKYEEAYVAFFKIRDKIDQQEDLQKMK